MASTIATRATPINLFDATAAGATLSKTLWPGAYTVTLPGRGSGSAAAILNATPATVGGVIAPPASIRTMLLDFCAVGTADQTLVVEIGKLCVATGIAQPIASVSLKSITTSGTVANVDPYTGEAIAATTFRLFDLAAVTLKGTAGQVFVSSGGAEDNTPCQIAVNIDEGVWYYAVITTLPAGLTRVRCAATTGSGVQVQAQTGAGAGAVAGAVTLSAGAATIGALTADQTVDLNKVAGAAVATGHGTAAGAIRVELPTDGTGAVVANPPTGTLVSSTAYEASHVLKASAGKLISLSGYNSKGSAQFIQVHNAASLPADTAVPILTFTVSAASNFNLTIPLTGLPCSTGVVVANSSTGPTLTVGSADVFFTGVVI